MCVQGAEVNGGRDDGRVQASTDTLQRGHAVVDNGRLIEFGLFVVGACAGATVPAYCALLLALVLVLAAGLGWCRSRSRSRRRPSLPAALVWSLLTPGRGRPGRSAHIHTYYARRSQPIPRLSPNHYLSILGPQAHARFSFSLSHPPSFPSSPNPPPNAPSPPRPRPAPGCNSTIRPTSHTPTCRVAGRLELARP